MTGRPPITRVSSIRSAAATFSLSSVNDDTFSRRHQAPAPESADLAFHAALLVGATGRGWEKNESKPL
ncbi:hypothetical protein [Rhodococcus jostii]|uniref:hypothetical protein n=1 Tax=Rhodococcus jostii TaxID=132919 RepID=UPI003660B710